MNDINFPKIVNSFISVMKEDVHLTAQDQYGYINSFNLKLDEEIEEDVERFILHFMRHFNLTEDDADLGANIYLGCFYDSLELELYLEQKGSSLDDITFYGDSSVIYEEDSGDLYIHLVVTFDNIEFSIGKL